MVRIVVRFFSLVAVGYSILLLGLTLAICVFGYASYLDIRSFKPERARLYLRVYSASVGGLNRVTFGIAQREIVSPLLSMGKIAGIGLDTLSSSQQYQQAVLGNAPDRVLSTYSSLVSNLESLTQTIPQLQDEIQTSRIMRFIVPDGLTNKLAQASQELDPVLTLVKLLPELTGPEDKEYIILLQNNMEIRPTGGFMGSFARIRFVQSAISDIEVQDIYVPDGQVEGYIPPPKPVEEYLYQTGGWKLRDANWDPHFSESARDISWFFWQAGEPNIDGIIGVNLQTVQAVMSALPPINLQDYNTTVRAENLYTVAQVESEHEFFPGATNKSDVLGAISRSFLLELEHLDAAATLAVLRALSDQLGKGEIVVWLNDSELQQYMATYGWDGSIRNHECTVQNCVSDNLYIVESNVSINKSNCCVDRAVIYDVSLHEDGTLTSQVELVYTNNNPRAPQPPRYYGGGYRNWMRIYTPSDQTVLSITSDRDDVALDDITTTDWHRQYGLFEYAFLAEIGGGESRRYTLSFARANRIDLSREGVYTLLVQKQPGIRTNGYVIRFQYPSSMNVVPEGTHSFIETFQDEKMVELQLTLDQDAELRFLLEPK